LKNLYFFPMSLCIWTPISTTVHLLLLSRPATPGFLVCSVLLPIRRTRGSRSSWCIFLSSQKDPTLDLKLVAVKPYTLILGKGDPHSFCQSSKPCGRPDPIPSVYGLYTVSLFTMLVIEFPRRLVSSAHPSPLRVLFSDFLISKRDLPSVSFSFL